MHITPGIPYPSIIDDIDRQAAEKMKTLVVPYCSAEIHPLTAVVFAWVSI